jgi:cytochrome c-type biogenesis protein CcmF
VIYELGHVALILGLAMALAQSVLPLVGAQTGNVAWMSLARPSARGQFLFLAIAYGCLTHAFITNDFSVALAANHSNSNLPLVFRITAVWGNHEGSILLWALILAGWTLAVSIFSRQLDDRMVARVLGVMGLISCGFLLFTLFTSNPFERLFPVPADGQDLNPLLQDAGMVIHPPMLYMGYVGFVVAFAFAVSALLSGRLDAAWARWSRPWTTVAWCFLTCGIALGSFWAYYELGWGGWWFWDPVENASFMPWLVGTALIHSLAVTEKRGAFKSWTVLLAISAFALSLLGTFLVRSGVLSSVHAFATDPSRGLFILGFLVVVVGASFTLYAWRAPSVGLGSRFGLFSRESLLLSNNVMLAAAMGAVLLGTLYPLLLDALGKGKISVGPPYFDTVFVPLMAPLVFLMGVGPLARWKQASVPEIAKRLQWALGVAVVAALLSGWLAGRISAMATLGLAMGWWVVASVATDLWGRIRPQHGLGLAERLRRVPRAVVGMMVAHLGVAVFIFGVTLVSTYQIERDVKMLPGEKTSLAGYEFTFKSTQEVRGPNYVAMRGLVEVTHNGKPETTMHPEKRIYRVQRNPMTEAAIDSGITRDLYVSMGEQVEGGAWIVRFYYKPFVNWIWGGCVVMVLGGLLAATDRRYRRRTAETDESLQPLARRIDALPQGAHKVATGT